MYMVSAESFVTEIALVESVDNQIGYELEPESKAALLSHMTELLRDLENEILLRDSQLILRDLEIKKNIQIIDNLYLSHRYQIGKFLIRPVEVVARKLGIIEESQNSSKNRAASANWTD